MKILKIIGFVLLGVIALIIIIGLVAPKEYMVERTVTINAPKELVFPHVKYWRNWQAWSPWAEMDSTMMVTVEGSDGELGSVYKWIGDPEITGKGEMINTGVTEFKEVKYHLHFLEPWESESDGYVRLTDAGENTTVAWGFEGETPFPWNVFMLLASMEEMIGPDFDRGLNLLKTICENEAESVMRYEVIEVEYPAKNFAAIRKVISMGDIQEFYATSFGLIEAQRRKKGLRMTGMPTGLYFSWDEQNKQTDIAASIPINGTISAGEIQTIKIPATTAVSVNHYGDYNKLNFAHQAIDIYLRKNNKTQQEPVIEEYITDPMAEPDTSNWLTRIYYLTN